MLQVGEEEVRNSRLGQKDLGGSCQWRTHGVSKGSADPPDIPRGARSGSGLSDHFDARSDGRKTGTHPRGEEDDGDCHS